MIKLADKICNVVDITHSPPHNWTTERKSEYLEWSVEVVAGLRDYSRALEDCFDRTIEVAREKINPL